MHYLTGIISSGGAGEFPSLGPVVKGVPSAESSRAVRGLGKGVSGKPYPRLCNARRPRLEPGTFRSQAVRLYRLHQARPSRPVVKHLQI